MNSITCRCNSNDGFRDNVVSTVLSIALSTTISPVRKAFSVILAFF